MNLLLSFNAIATSPSPMAQTLKKDYYGQEMVSLGIYVGIFSYQHLHLQPLYINIATKFAFTDDAAIMHATKYLKTLNKAQFRVAIPSGKFRTCPEFRVKFCVREEF